MSYPKSILTIDDQPDLLVILKAALEIYGDFEITTALGGVEGCKRAESRKYDVIICDLIMPDMDGEEVVEFIRSSSKNKETLLILLTGTPDVAEALQIENVVIVPKPIEPNDLVERIWVAWDEHQTV